MPKKKNPRTLAEGRVIEWDCYIYECEQCGGTFYLSRQMTLAQYKKECAKVLGGEAILCGTCYNNPDFKEVMEMRRMKFEVAAQRRARGLED